MASEKEQIEHYKNLDVENLIEEFDEAWARVRDYIDKARAETPTDEKEEEPEDDFEFVLPDFPDEDEEEESSEGAESEFGDGVTCMLEELTLEKLKRMPERIQTVYSFVKSVPNLVDFCPNADKLSGLGSMMDNEPFNVMLLLEMLENDQLTGDEGISFNANELLAALELKTMPEEQLDEMSKLEEKREKARDEGPVAVEDQDADAPVPVEAEDSDAPVPVEPEEEAAEQEEDEQDEPQSEEEDQRPAPVEVAAEPDAEDAVEVDQAELDALFGDPDAHRPSSAELEKLSATQWNNVVSIGESTMQTSKDVPFEKYVVAQEELDALFSGDAPTTKAEPTVSRNDDEADVEAFFGEDEEDEPQETMEVPVVKPGQAEEDEAETVQVKAVSPVDLDAIDQSEIDKLLDSESEDAEDDSEDDDDSALSQDDLDALFAAETGDKKDGNADEEEDSPTDQFIVASTGSVTDESQEIPSAETAEQDAVEPEGDKPDAPAESATVSQDDIEALFSEVQEETPEELEDDEVVLPPNHADEAEIDQEELDRLFDSSDVQTDMQDEASPEEDGPVDQAAIDAMLNQSADAEPEPEEPEDDGPVDQAAIDAMLNPSADAEPEPEEPEDDGPVDQAAIDAMLNQSADVESEEPEDDGPVDQAAIDAMLNQSADVESEDERADNKESDADAEVATDEDPADEIDNDAEKATLSRDGENETPRPIELDLGHELSAEEVDLLFAETESDESQGEAESMANDQQDKNDAVPTEEDSANENSGEEMDDTVTGSSDKEEEEKEIDVNNDETTVLSSRAVDPEEALKLATETRRIDPEEVTEAFDAVDPSATRKELSQEELDQIVNEVGKNGSPAADDSLPSEIGADENAPPPVKGLFGERKTLKEDKDEEEDDEELPEAVDEDAETVVMKAVDPETLKAMQAEQEKKKQ